MKGKSGHSAKTIFYFLHADNKKHNYTVVTVVTSKAVTLVTMEMDGEGM